MIDYLEMNQELDEAVFMRDQGCIPVWADDLAEGMYAALGVGPYSDKRWAFGMIRDLHRSDSFERNEDGEIVGESHNRITRFFLLDDDGVHHEHSCGSHMAIWVNIDKTEPLPSLVSDTKMANPHCIVCSGSGISRPWNRLEVQCDCVRDTSLVPGEVEAQKWANL